MEYWRRENATMTSGKPPVFRSLLKSVPSPQSSPDYLIVLKGAVTWRRGNVALSYVPDRLIVTEKSWGDYLCALGNARWDTLEEMALQLLNDVNNEIVPRWLRVRGSVIADISDLSEKVTHVVVVDDHQPLWDNFALIKRCSEH